MSVPWSPRAWLKALPGPWMTLGGVSVRHSVETGARSGARMEDLTSLAALPSDFTTPDTAGFLHDAGTQSDSHLNVAHFCICEAWVLLYTVHIHCGRMPECGSTHVQRDMEFI